MSEEMSELDYGIWPDGSYVIFYTESKTVNGTIERKDVLAACGSEEEALAAIKALEPIKETVKP